MICPNFNIFKTCYFNIKVISSLKPLHANRLWIILVGLLLFWWSFFFNPGVFFHLLQGEAGSGSDSEISIVEDSCGPFSVEEILTTQVSLCTE